MGNAPKGKMFKPVQVVNKPKNFSWTLPVELLAGRYYHTGTYQVDRSDEMQILLAKAVGGVSKKQFLETITRPTIPSSRRKDAMKKSSNAAESELLRYCKLYNPEEYERLRFLTPDMEGQSSESDDDDGRSIGYLDT